MFDFILHDALLLEADTFADQWHRAAGQTRLGTGEPYITHPRAVALRLHQLGFPRPVLAACLLHDVVEDTAATSEQIRTIFGEEVATLVREVTNVSRKEDGTRAERKAIDRDHVARASAEGQSIKAADIDHNISSVVEYNRSFASVYVPEKVAMLRVLTAAHPLILAQAQRTVADAAQRLGQLPAF